MNSLACRIAIIAAGLLVWAVTAPAAFAQVPPHAPGTVCFTPQFWCWAQPPGPPGYPCGCPAPGGGFLQGVLG